MKLAQIEIRGAAEPPLQDLDLDLPLGALISLQGPEGGGARELALRVLYDQSRRRYAQVFSAFERENLGGSQRGVTGQISGLPPALFLDGTVRQGPHLAAALQVETWLSRLWQELGESRCGDCGGLCQGLAPEAAAQTVVDQLPGATCLVLAPVEFGPGMADALQQAGFLRIRVGGQVRRLDEDEAPLGPGEVVIDRLAAQPAQHPRLVEAIRQARTLARGRSLVADPSGGVQLWLNQQLSCQRCGRQFGALPLPTLDGPAPAGMELRFQGWEWADLAPRRIEEVLDLLTGLAGWEGVRRPLAEAVSMGLGPLPLNRPLDQLSTGEHQALQLAWCLGLGLTGILFVLEHAGRGVDDRGQARLAAGLQRLVGQGNTVVLLGPPPALADLAQVSFDVVAGRVHRASPATARPPRPRTVGAINRWLRVPAGPGECRIPLGKLVALVGATGAGKTRWWRQVLLPGLQARRGGALRVEGRPALQRSQALGGARGLPDRMVVDQLGAFVGLAAQYAESSAAREKGYGREWFLLDRPGGRCPTCEGRGTLWCELEFGDDLALSCPACEGRRYRPEALETSWRGLNLAQALNLPVADAAHRYRGVPQLGEPLQAALGCGLGHRLLGEPCQHLGPAERLRLQLAGELLRAGPRDLLILEHPEAGGDAADLKLLVGILDELTERGCSVLVETHHPYLIAAAPWCVELSPGETPRSGATAAA